MSEFSVEVRDAKAFRNLVSSIKNVPFVAKRLFLPLFVYREHSEDVLLLCRQMEAQLFIALPDMIREKDRTAFLEDLEFLRGEVREKRVYGVLERCMEEYALLAEEPNMVRITDGALYQVNHRAFSLMAEGEDGITLSSELTWYEEKAFLDGIRKDPNKAWILELPVYGRGMLMVTANCIRNSNGKCDHVPGFSQELIDRKGQHIPFMTHCRYCQNILFNAKPLSLHNKWEQVGKLGEGITCRITFTTESAEETENILLFYASAFTKGVEPDSYTTGHFIKGVL